MYKNLLLLLVTVSLLVVIGCNERELNNCPAFKEELLVHLNYNLGDTLTYTNQINANELKFVVSEIIKSEPYKCTTEGFGNDGDCPCQNMVDFNIRGVGNNWLMRTGLLAEGFDDGTDSIDNPLAGFTVLSTDWQIDFQFLYTHLINYAPLLLKSFDSVIDEVEVNGTIYRDVVQSVVDTLNKPDLPELEVWRMLLVEGKGIIQFEDRTTRQIWSLKED